MGFTIQVADSSSPKKITKKVFTIAVVSGTPKLAVAPIPPAFLGSNYSWTFKVTEGKTPYTWSTNSTLPQGLSLNATAGILAGMVSSSQALGNFTLAIAVSGSNGKSASGNFILSVLPAFAWVTDSVLPGGKAGTSYSQNLTVSGGKPPYTFATENGSALPAGLTLNATTKRISGTPTASGNFSFTITAKDAASPANTLDRTFTLAIQSYGMSVNGTSAISGQRYKPITPAPFTVSGGVEPYTWSTTPALPAALTINATTGMISGNLTAAPGNYTVAVTVKDKGNQTASRNCTITILPLEPLIISSPADLGITPVNVLYTKSLLATGGRPGYTWSFVTRSNLPANATLLANGTFTANSSTALTANFTVRVADTLGANVTQAMTLRFVQENQVADFDNDGVNDYRELYDGTDPYDPTSFDPLSIGLVAHYPFTGNAKDESGFKNDGVVKGASLASYQFGNPNSTYEFNGLNSAIEVPDSESLRPQKQITLSAWVNIRDLQNYRRILTKGVNINDPKSGS